MPLKNVLIDVSVLAQKKSGVPIYTENLIDELLKLNSDSININLISSTPTPKFNKKYKVLSFNNKWSYRKIFWENFFLAKKIKSDIYHNPLFLLPRFRLSKHLKTIVTVHDLAFIEQSQSFDIRTKLYFKLFLNYSLKRADSIIAISNATSESIQKYFPQYKNKIKVIYNGFNDYRKYSDMSNKNIHNKRYFLQVGCMHSRKNLQISVENFSRLQKIEDINLICIGTSDSQKNEFKDIPGIIFLDNVSDIDLYFFYKNAVATLYPSQYEGFGFPILESMSAGCPVICSNIPSSKEISGYMDEHMFDLQCSNELLHLMKKLMNDSIYRDKIIDHGFKRINFFSWKKMAKEVNELYGSI